MGWVPSVPTIANRWVGTPFTTAGGGIPVPGEPEEDDLSTSSTLSDDGVWTFYSGPELVGDEARDRLYYGVASVSGDMVMGQWEVSSGDWKEVVVRTPPHPPDDHDNPVACVLPSGRVFVATMMHGDDRYRYRITDTSGDIETLGSEQEIATGGNSYLNPIWLDGRLYLFYRDSGWFLGMTYSEDVDGPGSATWPADQTLLQSNASERPYTHYAVDEDRGRIHFWATNGHPRDVAAGDNHIFHWYLDTLDGDKFKRSDGTATGKTLATVMAGTPLLLSDVTKVHDADAAATETGGNGNGWTWSIEIDPATGYPVASYTVYVANDDNRYRTARWNGSSWTISDFIVSGVTSLYGTGAVAEPQYTGGIVVDPRNVNRVYLSRVVSGQWELSRWLSEDVGETYDLEHTITSSSGSAKNFRPVVPFNWFTGCPKIAWPRGTYATFGSWNTRIMSSPSITRVFDPINDAVPSISGTTTTGETLTVVPGTWRGGPTPSLTYQWERDGSAISGATNSTYVLQVADEGADITVVETATNSGGSANAESEAVVPSAGGGPFHPSNLGSFWGLWDSTDLAGSDGDLVASWPESTGNGRNFGQSTDADKFTLQTNELNGAQVLEASGATDFMFFTTAGGLGQTGDMHLFAVVKQAGGGQDFWNTRVSSTGWIWRLTASGMSFGHIGATPSTTPGPSLTGTNWNCIELRRESLLVQQGVNGTLNSGASLSNNPPSSTRVEIARNNGTGTAFSGQYRMLLAFSGALSSGDRQDVLDWIEAETGVTLP